MKLEISIQESELTAVVVEHVKAKLGPNSPFTHIEARERYGSWEVTAKDDAEHRVEVEAELKRKQREASRAKIDAAAGVPSQAAAEPALAGV